MHVYRHKLFKFKAFPSSHLLIYSLRYEFTSNSLSLLLHHLRQVQRQPFDINASILELLLSDMKVVRVLQEGL